MRLKSRGLGRKELVMDFREYKVVPRGKEIVIEGTITEPVHWDFTIRMCQDDLPGITKVLFKKDTILFLLKAAFTRNKDNHWSSHDDDDSEDPKSAVKKTAKKEAVGAGTSSSSDTPGASRASDRAAKIAEAKARAAQAKANVQSTTAAPAAKAEPSAPGAKAEPSAPAAAKPAQRPKFDAAQSKAPRAKVKAEKTQEPPPPPKPKRTGAPLAGDDYDRSLKTSTESVLMPSASSFATGKTVTFGAARATPATPKPTSGQDAKPAKKKTGSKEDSKTQASKQQATTSSDSKDKKTGSDTKSAPNGGKKTLEVAEGTKS